MKQYNPIRDLSSFERRLWGLSAGSILLSFLWTGSQSSLTLTAALIGVTALIFVAKGYVIGQLLTVVFAVFYGIISLYFRYYGEMITYLGMTAPIALLSAISWLKHPYQKTKEVKVHRLSAKEWAVMTVLAAVTTFIFYFILKALGNANLLISTISVTTSFVASGLTFLRSPFYALGYAANDLVLVVLWVQAALTDPASLPMVVCFVMFFANDIYGFFSWRAMQHRQAG